ncbi:MAG: glycosyltransferase family 61 protein [Alphaproteobacteria bacterium]|nr:glycosyltransferase family 61 protein [Alphaproteobacteria bacterium]
MQKRTASFPLSDTATARNGLSIGAIPWWPIRCAKPRRADAFRVAHLVVPWTLTGYHMPHPRLRPYFNALREQVPACDLPRRLFIDRRRSERQPGAPRSLVNADEVIAALERDGFTAMELETLSFAEQIALFAGAERIVAPHDVGLANLVFAGPDCRLIELHSDHQVNWAFRHLAAVCGVRYDAVLGRQIAQVPAGPGGTRFWQVSALHVRGAAGAALGRTG